MVSLREPRVFDTRYIENLSYPLWCIFTCNYVVRYEMALGFGPLWLPFETEIANDSRASVSVFFSFLSNVPVVRRTRSMLDGGGGGRAGWGNLGRRCCCASLTRKCKRTPCCVVVYTYYLRRSVARPNWSLVRCSPDTRIYRRPVSAQTLPSGPIVRCFPDERPRTGRRRCTCECWTSVCASLVSASKRPGNGNGRYECSPFFPENGMNKRVYQMHVSGGTSDGKSPCCRVSFECGGWAKVKRCSGGDGG